MRQTFSEYHDPDEHLGLVGEDRADEYARPDRRLPMMLLTVAAMALFAGGLWFAYVQGTRHPVMSVPGDAVPLIRADERPTKVKPDQPGGMAIPDQNVSLYNEKPGGAPVEKLLPAPEQPMPRPAPAARRAGAGSCRLAPRPRLPPVWPAPPPLAWARLSPLPLRPAGPLLAGVPARQRTLRAGRARRLPWREVRGAATAVPGLAAAFRPASRPPSRYRARRSDRG